MRGLSYGLRNARSRSKSRSARLSRSVLPVRKRKSSERRRAAVVYLRYRSVHLSLQGSASRTLTFRSTKPAALTTFCPSWDKAKLTNSSVFAFDGRTGV